MKTVICVTVCLTLFISCNTKSKIEQKREDFTEKSTKTTENSEEVILLDLTDPDAYELLELNSVNMHLLTQDELQSEKEKIDKLTPSLKYFEWDIPTSGGAVHINSKDEVEVYNCDIRKGSANDSRKVSIDALWLAVQGFTWGNAPSVLITSEMDAQKSKSLKLVVDELFKHQPRIFYINKTSPNNN